MNEGDPETRCALLQDGDGGSDRRDACGRAILARPRWRCARGTAGQLFEASGRCLRYLLRLLQTLSNVIVGGTTGCMSTILPDLGTV
mmetsp:Transcript_65862/g.106796  ORF Transcript_65862/g.106796 Transcript_65862/m.106796 type:complete len:87 (+) Transcript_65862:254-514(+)